MGEVDLEFLGRQIAVLIDGQRDIRSELGAVKSEIADLRGEVADIRSALAETATRDLLLRVLRSFEGQVEVAGIRTELLRETLTARIAEAERRIEALEKA